MLIISSLQKWCNVVCSGKCLPFESKHFIYFERLPKLQVLCYSLDRICVVVWQASMWAKNQILCLFVGVISFCVYDWECSASMSMRESNQLLSLWLKVISFYVSEWDSSASMSMCEGYQLLCLWVRVISFYVYDWKYSASMSMCESNQLLRL